MDPFIVKKLISIFIGTVFPAAVGIAILALVSVKFPRFGRMGIIFVALILIGLLSPLTSNFLIETLESQYPRFEHPGPSTRYIAVLSGGKGGRVVEAIRLWKLAPDAQFVTTTVPESDYVESGDFFTTQAALGLGIPESKLISIPDVQDTQDEIGKIAELVEQEKIIVVSSAVHLPRVAMIVESYGLNADFAPSASLRSKLPWWSFNTGAIDSVDRVLHEYVGMIWFRLVRGVPQ